MQSGSIASPSFNTLETLTMMEHKAFAFDWSQFDFDLAPLLLDALTTGETAELEAFIDTHLAELKHPDEGEPLPADWREMLENGDVHEFGDYAFTRYYDPDDCRGVGYAWAELSEQLPDEAVIALLGAPVGPAENLFDPGRYGSYFQCENAVRGSLKVLKVYDSPDLAEYLNLLKQCVKEQRGLYVTF
jgi:hypothetical protein